VVVARLGDRLQEAHVEYGELDGLGFGDGLWGGRLRSQGPGSLLGEEVEDLLERPPVR
jgi:hypothetical protein